MDQTSLIVEKPQRLTVKHLKAFLKEAKRALYRMQNSGAVGDVYKDKLAKKYKDNLKLVTKSVNRLRDVQRSQASTLWGAVCFIFPLFRSPQEQAMLTLHLSTAWDTIESLYTDFLSASEQRNLDYVGYGFSPSSQHLLTTTIPTSTAVSYFADHLGLKGLSPVDQLTKSKGDGTLELETPEIAKQWFKKAYIKEIDDIEGFGVKDGLSRAIRLVIFMMDDLGPSPLEQTLGEVRDLLEQSMKLLILLMRFTNIPEALDNVEEQLENALTILYHIYAVMCWHMRRVPDTNQSLHAGFEMLRFSYDFIQSPSEHITIIRKSLQAVVADTLDKKAKHWRLLSAEDTVASVAPVISNRLDVCHSLSAILSECRPYELGFDYMPSDDEILAIFNSTMSDVLKPSPEMEELTSVDLLLHELDRLEIPHLMVTRDTVKSHSVGRGAFGIVYKSRIIGRNRFYDAVAVKIPDIGKDKGSYSTSKTILAEAKIWQTLYAKAHAVCQPDQRQLIAPLLGFCVVTDCSYPGLISPFYAHGNLKEFLKNKNPLFSERLHLLLDVAYALKLMHSAHIVYADLKAENVLIDSTGHACLTDFGSAVELPTFGESTVRPTTERRTSERVPGDVSTDKTYQSDIYSFGFLCIEAAIARTPFMDEQELIHDIMTMGSSLAPAGDVHRRLRTLVRNCLDPDPVQRPDANYLISTLKDLVDSL